MPSNNLSDTHASATHSGFLVPVSAEDQEPSGRAALQTIPTNVSGTQSSASWASEGGKGGLEPT